MEIITECNNLPVLVTPLMHREVVRSRPSAFKYDAVASRIERDRNAIETFLSRIEPYCNHANLARIASHPTGPGEPYWGNQWFDAGDARAAYGVVAALRPKQIIEIGSGNSTMFMHRAIRDFDLATEITSIDPAPRAEIDEICDRVIRKSVLEVDLEVFSALRPGDILFHDGSHLTFNGTDTVRLFLEILPILAPGVIVHIHDICLPFEYLEHYDNRGYSEQYMLASALLYSDELEVLLPIALLAHEKKFEGGGSFWLRKRSGIRAEGSTCIVDGVQVRKKKIGQADPSEAAEAALISARAALLRYIGTPDEPALREEVVRAVSVFAEAVSVLGSFASENARKQVVDLVREVAQSGLHDAEVIPSVVAAAGDYAAKGETGLYAAMLLVPGWQWPKAPKIARVPESAVGDYVKWLFTAPQGFVAPGQAALFPERMLRWLDELVGFLEKKGSSAVGREALLAYLQSANCIPLYFCDESLRRHYELRARVLQYTAVGSATGVRPRPRAGRRLRVGFINRHFGSQTETYTTLPTFEQLDPERFEVVLFSLHFAGSKLEEHARNRAARFEVLPADPQGQIDRLRAAELDIAVFGTNVTAVYHEITRLALHRVAPLQVANNSSCTTTGLPEIDLYVSGRLTECDEAPQHFSERLGLLPGPAHAFDYEADKQEPSRTWTRQALGIPEDALVFVSAANYFKVIPEMQHAWARLLAAVPGSRLLLHPFNPNWSSSYPIKRFSAGFDRVLEAHGVDRDRLLLSTEKLPSRSDVKELLRVGDVYLDTFPFGGVNSLVDPLELGMPVVAWEGRTFRSRMGAALLRELGLQELIAGSADQYLEITTRLAREPEHRKTLTERIAHQMSRAPSFLDPLAASDALGALLEKAYDELCAVGRERFRECRTPIIVSAPEATMQRVEAGVACLEANDLAGAEACVREVLGAQPTHSAACQLMGAVLLRKGQAVRAVDYLLGAVQRTDRDAPLWYDLAVALNESGRRAQAVEALQACLRIDPKQVEPWLMLAQLAEAMGQNDLVGEALEMASQIAPGDERIKAFQSRTAPTAPLASTAVAMKHILVFTDDPEHGGVAHYNHALLLALARAGYRVSCVQSASNSPLTQEQRGAGVRHIWLEYDTGKDFSRTLNDTASAERIFRAELPDLVVFSDCCPVSNLAARQAAIAFGIPYIVIVGFVGAYLARNFAAHLPRLAEQYTKARAVVAVSHENLGLLRQHFGLSATHGQVIHNSRPAKFFAPRDPAVRARLRAERNIPMDAVVCFTAARLAAVKGFDLQIAAITRLQQHPIGKRVHFVWAGDGEQRPELEQEISRLEVEDRVHLLGQRWDVGDWYDAADIVVFPSRLEGMPLGVMEAMAKGVPVVATAVSGIPEELGDTGWLLGDPSVDPQLVIQGLADAIAAWAADPAARAAAGEKGRRRAERMFREELMIQRTLELVGANIAEAQPQRPAVLRESAGDASISTNGTLRTFETREDMLAWLPKGGRWAEIGVFKGEFAEKILSICKPERLILVDMWEGTVYSGDVNGNHGAAYRGEDLYRLVRSHYGANSRVTIVRAASTDALNRLPDHALDAVYVDADHSYEACRRDIGLAWRKLKPGGWLCGHDYLVNGEKATAVHPMGVRRAVDEFCRNQGCGIAALAMDGYVSYAIRKPGA